MAGAQEVQAYLQKHKIGNMFEDLMAKVVSDMPDDPVLYMIQTLERKATRMGSKAMMRRSTGDLAHMRSSSPDKAATFAGSTAVAKDRPYTKPWQTNTKRQKNKTEPAPRRPKTAGERPDWDGKVKGAESNLDDFWGDSDAINKHQRRTASPTRTRTRTSLAEDDEDEDLLYRSQGYAGPRRLYEGTDPLSGEFSLTKTKPAPSRQVAPVLSSGRVSGQAADALKHRQQLARIIQDSHRQNDSGIEDDRDLDADDAVELLEDVDDLRSEGVNYKKKSGPRVKPMRRSGLGADPQVRVSICAGCAKVMNGPRPSELAEGLGYGELPDFDVDDDREFPESRPQSSARFTDDEFESVSQVSGPRRPVWQNDDSDNEAQSAPRGRHMFTSSGVASKGRPMYSPERGQNVRTSTARDQEDVYKSVDSATTSKSLKGHSAFNRTWTEGVGHSDDEPKQKPVDQEKIGDIKENEDDYPAATYPTRYLFVSQSYDAQLHLQDEPSGKGVTFRTEDNVLSRDDSTSVTLRQDEDDDGASTALSLHGAGWAQPATDYDSDISAPAPRVSRTRGKVRQYQGQY